MQANIDERVLLRQHQTLEDRVAAARQGVERLGLTLPVLVDGMDDAVSETFAAWPERLYVADRAGRITYIGGPGPFEFEPEAAEWALVSSIQETGPRPGSSALSAT
jgi:hypothetical protein